MSLFDVYEGKEGDSFKEGWKNKLLWGDNLLVMVEEIVKLAVHRVPKMEGPGKPGLLYCWRWMG